MTKPNSDALPLGRSPSDHRPPKTTVGEYMAQNFQTELQALVAVLPTAPELQALNFILSRCPLTPAEALWLQALLDRLAAQSGAAQTRPDKET